MCEIKSAKLQYFDDGFAWVQCCRGWFTLPAACDAWCACARARLSSPNLLLFSQTNLSRFRFRRCIRPIARPRPLPSAVRARSPHLHWVPSASASIVSYRSCVRAGQVVQFTLDVANDRFTFRMFFITFYVNNNGYIHLGAVEQHTTQHESKQKAPAQKTMCTK